jgi:hypothetical protein
MAVFSFEEFELSNNQNNFPEHFNSLTVLKFQQYRLLHAIDTEPQVQAKSSKIAQFSPSAA